MSTTKFLNDFAERSGFDPLNAEKWSSVTNQDIMKEKVKYHAPICAHFSQGGWNMLQRNEDSLQESLKSAYPTVDFDAVAFRARKKCK